LSDKKEIDRPLGQGQKSLRPADARARISFATAVTVLAAVAVLGASAMIALRERPWRQPEVVATRQADAEAPAEPKPRPEIQAATQPGGSRIIRVQPEESGGEGGAIVVRDPSALQQDLRVAHLPDRALVEETGGGPLPVRAADGRRPFDVYARPWSGTRGARVAIVIGGLAVSQTGTQAAIARLPPEVTLAFASGGNSIGRWMQEGRRKGHEIVMQMPMEPFDYPNVDPGRNTLTVDAAPDDNLQAMRRVLSRTTNYTTVMSRAPELAQQERMPVAIADTQIDAMQDRTAILKKLDELEATARAKGSAIGIGSAFDVTVDAVASWVDEAKMRGIEIVPVSAVANDPEKR
jgi:polysaccharide deacetylase 2 family uncharacterized protein YibQ/uncharacterized Fe-S cluster protein YjdI